MFRRGIGGLIVLALLGLALAPMPTIAAPADIQMPGPDPSERLVIAADHAHHWTDGKFEVYLIGGKCYVNQGLTYARGQYGLIWIERGGAFGDPPHKLVVYLEGDVSVDYEMPRAPGDPPQHAQIKDRSWFGKFQTSRAIALQVNVTEGQPNPLPAVYQHAVEARDAQFQIRPVQFIEDPGPVVLPPSSVGNPAVPASPVPVTPESVPLPPQEPTFHIGSRNAAQSLQQEMVQGATPDEKVFILSGGVNIVISNYTPPPLPGFVAGTPTTLDIEADRIVVWFRFPPKGSKIEARDIPAEIYMEGNVVFREGERKIEAQQMYYDVQRKVGTVLKAELNTPITGYEGVVRLKADALRVLDQHHYVADGASLTTSRFGVPGYELRSDQIIFTDEQQPVIDPFTQQQQLDLNTGEPRFDHQQLASSQGNFLYFEDYPVFYWPYFQADLKKSNYLIDHVRFRQDKIFGTQLQVDWDAYQLFGCKNKPEGTKWDISTDYFSKRGFGLGTDFAYDRPNLFDIPGRGFGLIDAWGIRDDGLDVLGRDRRDLNPEKHTRGRLLARHRQLLPDNYQVTAEVGLISDRNFLEQYYEHEWDDLKDQNTGIELKHTLDSMSWDIAVDLRPNGFWTDTQQLPRLDHFTVGKSLLFDWLTWYEHSSAGYYRMRTATTPLNLADSSKFTLLPYEAPVSGERLATKHELDLPFNVGPVKVVPYALGELDHWGEGLDGNDQNRAFTQLGARGSYLIWDVDPNVESELFYLRGLSHKVTFDADVAWSHATNDMTKLPLYDAIDDNNIETFRRRFAFDTFGTPGVPAFPAAFDPRFYALRSSLAGDVTSPSTEIADDLLAARLGVRQRWQTKRGGPNTERIVDWISLDTEAVLFPNPDRDNFGSVVGLVDYNFVWNVGDRVSVVSDGMFDFFSQAPRYVSIGTFLSRPPRGSFYFGVRSLEGPISSTVFTTSYSYRVSDKWISTFNSNFALGKTGNIGQTFGMTRIGESFLVSFGVNVDASKGNFGANISIEPRFLPGRRLTTTGGVVVPPAGLYGLE